ncbi:transferase family-domain-containing protein [Hypoxylon argillaceum]|nr:transferase family-domain-containing protein [Hypoxylon argillaceum]
MLSNLDMVSPNSLISSFLLYKLEPEYNVKLVTEAVTEGLQVAAEQIPLLRASIRFDGGKPRKKLSQGSLRFRVRHFNRWEHKSYDELAAASFRPSELDQASLVPVEAYDNAEEKPVLVTQLSFIPGGAILALGFNHIASDGVSRDLALTAICRASKAHMQGLPAPRTSFDFRRSLLATPRALLQKPRDQLAEYAKDYSIMDAVAVAGAAAAAKAGRSANAANKTNIYRIQGAAVDELKRHCKPMGGVEYIATYDCVVGMLWKSLMSARAQVKPQLRDADSRILHAVDLRGRTEAAPSRRYFGNAVKQVGAGPLPMAQLLGPDGLSLAASYLRKSILETSVADVGGATALAQMMGPSETLVFFPRRGIADQDFMLSSWYFMDTAEYDFGMGPPAAVRPPDAAIPGFAFLFPDCERRDGSRCYDIYLTLPVAEQEALSRDEVFRRWFSIV